MYKMGFWLLGFVVLGCSDTTNSAAASAASATTTSNNEPARVRHYAGAISNGMKGDSLFFDVSADGKQLQNLTFKGYWRCSGRLEQTIAGPDGSFPIENNKVASHISEPPDGGSTAWRFELEAALQADKASGSFRMNINNLGCDTYKLQWTAVRQ